MTTKKKGNLLKLKWIYTCDDIDWNELSNLYKIAPLGDKKPDNLKTVFSNSKYKCFIYHDNILIGVGRALADGFDCSYICDVAIHPNYQRQGIGKSIIDKLLEFSKEYQKIILFSNIGKEGLYSKFGFAKMNTAMAIFKNQEKAIEIGLLCKR